MSDDDRDGSETAVDPRVYGSPRSRTSTMGRNVTGSSAIDARDRAYGPFLTWEDLRDHAKALEANTLAMEEHQIALRANTTAQDLSRDAAVELTKAIDRFNEIMSPKPA